MLEIYFEQESFDYGLMEVSDKGGIRNLISEFRGKVET